MQKINKGIQREYSRKKFGQFFSNYNALRMSEQNMKKPNKGPLFFLWLL